METVGAIHESPDISPNIHPVGAIHESPLRTNNTISVEAIRESPKQKSSLYTHRRSLRLKGYDYSKKGAYFITICVKDMVCMFGEIVNGEMKLNEYGMIANKYLTQIPEKYNQTRLHDFIVMPNHIHAIIEITSVGAIHESPDILSSNTLCNAIRVGAIHESPLQTNNTILTEAIRESPKQELPLRDQRRKMLLSKIVGWYKMNVAKQINILRQLEGSAFWQRNYYEHIIRSEKSYETIASYIMNNPANWKDDKFYRYAD